MNFTSAIILAAGSGTRFGGEVKKQFVEILGYTALQRCALAFDRCKHIDELVFVGDKAEISAQLASLSLTKPFCITDGGETRQKSAMNGFKATSKKSKYVAIHDSARCLITPEIISSVVKTAYQYRASLAAERAVDTIKIVGDYGYIEETVNRDKVWLAKTPQVFLSDMYRVGAYTAEKDGAIVTDDCMLVERLGFKVYPVDCGSENIKLTNPEDLHRAVEILSRREGKK